MGTSALAWIAGKERRRKSTQKEPETKINTITLKHDILLSAIKEAKNRRYANNKGRKLTEGEKQEVSKEIQATLARNESQESRN